MKRKRPGGGYEETVLLGALAEEGCPICQDTAGSDDRFFFWFFNENYYEGFTLDGLTRSLGFCLAHGTTLARNGAGAYQLAAVHEVLARRLLGALAVGAPAVAAGGPCPACQDRDDQVARAAFWLAKYLEDPAKFDRYARPGLLCFPHVQVVSPRLSGRTLERLLTVHDSAMAAAEGGAVELRAEIDGTSSAGPQDQGKALLPSLRLAVGNDRGNGAHPSPDESSASPRRRGSVSDFLEYLGRAQTCPVCLEVRRAWTEWVRWLEDAVRKGSAVEDLLPLCPEHVWATVHAGGPFLAAVTAGRALAATMAEVKVAARALNPPRNVDLRRSLRQRIVNALWAPRLRLQAAREVLARPLQCPVCERLSVARDRVLALLFALVEDRRYRALWEESYGLCLKHLSRALALGPKHEVRSSLLEVEGAKLAHLQWELEEFLRKVGWNARPEAKGSELDAWRRGVARFSGSLMEVG